MNRKEAYESSRDKWTKIIKGREAGGLCGFCGFFGVTLISHKCHQCPLYPEVCGHRNSAYIGWMKSRSPEYAMKVLEGVIKYGLPWSEEEENSKDVTDASVVTDYCSFKKSERPKPKFEVGDKVTHCTNPDDVETIDSVRWAGLRDCYNYTTVEYGSGELHEENLKPAPKEVWVDVTRECDKRFDDGGEYHWVGLWHGNLCRIVLGQKAIPWCTQDGKRPYNNEDYKVEYTVGGKNHDGFKILHKQEEK